MSEPQISISNNMCCGLLTNHTKIILLSQLVKKFPAFYGNCTLSTLFTRAYYLILFQASWIQSMQLQPISVRSMLILSYIFLGLPIFSFRFSHQNTVWISPPYVYHMLILPDVITLILYLCKYKMKSFP